MEINVIGPEHEVSGFVNTLEVSVSVDFSEHLFTYWSVDFVKLRFFERVAFFHTSRVNMVSEVKLVNKHGNFSHGLAVFIQVHLIYGIPYKVAGIVIQNELDNVDQV